MEKTLSPDERIRRAEEIYYRRKMQSSRRETATVNVNDSKKNYKLFSKMITQIIICIIIYTTFYFIQNANHVFSEEIKQKAKQILEYDINIQKLYEQTSNYINNIIFKNSKEQGAEEKTAEEQNTIEEINTTTQEETPTDTAAIGGDTTLVEAAPLSQMELDVNEILEKYTLIKPVIGTVTSEFGERESQNTLVTPYHTGIDIGADEGTLIVAAMEGYVEKISSEGDYRKSFKNNKWRYNNSICTLQSNTCRTGEQCKTRTRNSKGRFYGKFYWSTLAF